MEFTALELLLGGGFISMVTAIVAHCVAENRYVTRHEFEEFRMDMKNATLGWMKIQYPVPNEQGDDPVPSALRAGKAKILNTPPRGEA